MRSQLSRFGRKHGISVEEKKAPEAAAKPLPEEEPCEAGEDEEEDEGAEAEEYLVKLRKNK